MHDAKQASEELTRCVKDYGMVGAMINDFQNGPDGKPLYYDQPEYDIFWKTAQDLDVVIYMHPRFPHPSVIENLFGDRRGLLGACWYAVHSSPLIGIGVFRLAWAHILWVYVRMVFLTDFRM
jgi:2,3-dihydroxybenzoate decarboxylase